MDSLGENSQPPNSSPNDADKFPHHSKVLQPSSAFLKEMKTAASPNIQDQPQQVPAVPSPSNSIPDSAPQSPPNSIYPQPTNDSIPGSYQAPMANLPKNTEKDSRTTKNKLIIFGVMVLGAYIALSALLTLFSSLKILSFGFVGNRNFLILIDVIYLLIGIGLMLRNEIARLVYVIIGVIGLVIAIYGTYHYFSVNHAVQNLNNSAVIQTQNEITQYQDNSSIPASQKQLIITELQQQITQEQSQVQQYNKAYSHVVRNEYISIGEAYLLAIVPLVFLTRSSVKEIFS